MLSGIVISHRTPKRNERTNIFLKETFNELNCVFIIPIKAPLLENGCKKANIYVDFLEA